MSEVATRGSFDPQSDSPEQLVEYAIAVRSVIPEMDDPDALNQIEAVLVAVAKRLRQLGASADEAERSRILAMQRLGELWEQAGEQRGGDRRSEEFQTSNITSLKATQAEMDRRSQARLLAQQPETVKGILATSKVTLNRAIKMARQHKKAKDKIEAAATVAQITLADWRSWLPEQDECDLLLTDPPYSTDVEDIYSFANAWLPEALKKVKPTGRAYVCIGAYPEELHAYLSVPCGELTLANVLVWTYRNTLGPSPSYDYKLNWQAILYYRGPVAPPLDCPKMTEQFSVQDINAPDGRQGDRYHAWQKPSELGERFVRHATKPGEVVLDPFAGTGTFLLAAAALGREARGCEPDEGVLGLAVQRGCRRG